MRGPQAELSLGEVDLASPQRPKARWLRLLANRHGNPVGKDLGCIQARLAARLRAPNQP